MKIVYSSASGDKIDFSSGDVRAVAISGICPEKEITIHEGSDEISESRGTRSIKLRTVICGDFEKNQSMLIGITSISGLGRLEISGSGGKLGIDCCVKSVEADIISGTNYADIVFICPNPYFENTGSSDVYVQICGSTGKWKFDDWEISENEETELSEILIGNSAYVPNSGSFNAGCIITVEMLGDASEVTVINASTKKFVGVRGDFSVGDIIIFRCIDGEKGIYLSSVYNEGKMENITHRIVWGSEFFKVAQGGVRVSVNTSPIAMRASAYITLKEYSEGF